MTRPVSELTGADLALWVARACGYADAEILDDDCAYAFEENGSVYDVFKPHEDWAQGGPLIEKHRISIGAWDYPGQWGAYWLHDNPGNGHVRGVGDTPLIAAMRALVASVYGDEVPEKELT